MVDERKAIEEECANVARTAFPHVADTRRRVDLERALIEFACAITDLTHLLALSIEARLAGLEKDSHPAVPLRPLIIEEVTAAIRRGQIRGIAR